MDTHRPLLIFRTYIIFWMICAGVLTVNLLFYALSIRPADARSSALRMQWMAERNKQPESRQDDDMLKKYLNAKKALQTFQNMLPEEKEAGTISGELLSFFSRNGVTSETVRLVPQNIGDLFVLKYGADITVSGSYPEIKKLLADIQNSPSLFCIEKLSLDYENEVPHQVKMQLTLTTYFRNSGKGKPDAG